jgi:hypothetical protein
VRRIRPGVCEVLIVKYTYMWMRESRRVRRDALKQPLHLQTQLAVRRVKPARRNVAIDGDICVRRVKRSHLNVTKGLAPPKEQVKRK